MAAGLCWKVSSLLTPVMSKARNLRLKVYRHREKRLLHRQIVKNRITVNASSTNEELRIWLYQHNYDDWMEHLDQFTGKEFVSLTRATLGELVKDKAAADAIWEELQLDLENPNRRRAQANELRSSSAQPREPSPRRDLRTSADSTKKSAPDLRRSEGLKKSSAFGSADSLKKSSILEKMALRKQEKDLEKKLKRNASKESY